MNLRETLSKWIDRWAAFVAREEARWRDTLRAEGAQGDDVHDPAPDTERPACGTEPETPSLLDEAVRRKDQIRHGDRR